MRHHVMRRNGFTLVEALAALAILALSLAALLSGVSGAARNDDRADFLLRASRLARSQLDAVGIAAPIVVGETTDRSDDGLRWTLTMEPFKVAGAPSAAPKTISYWARLTIRKDAAGNASQTMTFVTLKLVQSKEPQSESLQ